MKYKIVALIEKAGFTYVGEGRGIGAAEGRKVSHYKKDSYGSTRECQNIQLATYEGNDNDILPIFSLNVPQNLRDAVYTTMNASVAELARSYQF